MRLWHQDLIHYLPRQQLLGQHRECCALRGKGWGKKHSVVNYVFEHPYSWLWLYHKKVMEEISSRGYKVDSEWLIHNFHGKKLGYSEPDDRTFFEELRTDMKDHPKSDSPIPFQWKDLHKVYLEHDDKYLLECVENLRAKGAELVNGKTLSQFRLELSIKGL